MNRRLFLKASAAALCVPFVGLRREVDREALMLPFCCDHPYPRYDIESPFQHGSLTYATDSRRIVRAEIAKPKIVGEGRLPPVAALWDMRWRPKEWIEIDRPDFDSLKHRRDGVPDTCPECLGRMVSCGETYPSEDELNELLSRGVRWDVDDNTKGDESCPRCRGCEYEGPSVLEVCGVRLAYDVACPVWDLPGPVRFAVLGEELPVLFAADGFEGMVMPLVKTA